MEEERFSLHMPIHIVRGKKLSTQQRFVFPWTLDVEYV